MYKAVEKMFELQLGKHLLALSSPSQLNSIMDQNLPYLVSHGKALNECLSGKNCQEIENLTDTIGKSKWGYLSYSFIAGPKAWKLIQHPPHLVDSDSLFAPNAFIPFCSFGGDMNITGYNNAGLEK